MEKRTQQRLYLTKVERKFLAKVKELTPEYSDLELEQVAHLELKTRLLDRVREILKKNSLNSDYTTSP